MLYIAYLPKRKGEHINIRKVNNTIKNYSKFAKYQNSILASPGFMSKKYQYIQNYVNELAQLVSIKGTFINFGLLNGMNGWNFTTGGPHIDVRNAHIKCFPKEFININLNPNKKSDHRKVMCFYTYNDSNSIYDNDVISNVTFADFINKIHVNAVLIGSSNQSNNTYFDNVASKGEADLFIINENQYLNNRFQNITENDIGLVFRNFDNEKENINNRFVVTKSFLGQGHSETDIFLKEIIKDCLLNGID